MESLQVGRANLRNLTAFLKAADLEAARLELELLTEYNPTSTTLFEMQGYLQDAAFWDSHRDDCEWQHLKGSAVSEALALCKKVRRAAKYLPDM